MDTEKYVIKQISIFSENRPGRLAAVAHALGEEKINILAFSIAEANGFGVIRALVDHPEKAHKKLSSMGYNVAFTDVIAVQMKDQPGGTVRDCKGARRCRDQHRVFLCILRKEGRCADPPRGPG